MEITIYHYKSGAYATPNATFPSNPTATRITNWNEASINFKYNCITDTFAFKVLFNPYDPVQKETFIPGGFWKIVLSHHGQTVLTGNVLNHKFERSENKTWCTIEGYNLCGMLGDCYLTSDLLGMLIQTNVSLKELCTQISEWFALPLPVVDVTVTDKCDAKFASINWCSKDGTDTQQYPRIADKIQELCNTKDVILSHTANGGILLTQVKVDDSIAYNPIKTTLYPAIQPAFNYDALDIFNQEVDLQGNKKSKPPLLDNSAIYFDNKPIWLFQANDGLMTSCKLSFNGQSMHSDIQVYIQQGNKDPVPDTRVVNPYVLRNGASYDFNDQSYNPELITNFRPRVSEQTVGDTFDTSLSALQILGNELENIVVVIEIAGWEINGRLIRPNCLIELFMPDLFIYKKTKFFVTEVQLNGNERGNWATLVCCLPDCFQDKEDLNFIVNIFDNNVNLNSLFDDERDLINIA